MKLSVLNYHNFDMKISNLVKPESNKLREIENCLSPKNVIYEITSILYRYIIITS